MGYLSLLITVHAHTNIILHLHGPPTKAYPAVRTTGITLFATVQNTLDHAPDPQHLKPHDECTYIKIPDVPIHAPHCFIIQLPDRTEMNRPRLPMLAQSGA